MTWREFEASCLNYLIENYGEYASFSLSGGSNSNASDILVKTKSQNEFYIEVKKCPSQCGQFVLYEDTKNHKFKFSDKNKN